MAAARREQQRQLALDVWRLTTDKKFDAGDFVRTGAVNEWLPIGEFPLPDNPLIHAEIARMEREKKLKRDRFAGRN